MPEEIGYDGWLQRMYCQDCKNNSWVPDYGEGNEELTAPAFCPFCGIEFDGITFDDEGGAEDHGEGEDGYK